MKCIHSKYMDIKLCLSLICIALLAFLSSCNNDDDAPASLNAQDDGCECLNDLQVIGSHNSYKLAVEQPIIDFIATIDQSLAKSIEYEHTPLFQSS